MYLFMEFCESGDLRDFVKKRGGRLTEAEARYVIRDVLRGMTFLQEECSVMHRDIKLDNVLVKLKPGLRLKIDGLRPVSDFEFKIGDMGLAKPH